MTFNKHEVEKIIENGVALLGHVKDSETNHIDGINRLSRKIQNEISFLKKIQHDEAIKPEYVKCSPLLVLASYWSYIKSVEKCTSVFKRFRFLCNNEERKLIVDVVSHDGEQWNKIICRNPRALTRIWKSSDLCNRRSVIDKGTDLIQCSKQNQLMFKSPRIVFYFTRGIESELANALQRIGIHVKGEIINYIDGELMHITEEFVDNGKELRSLNLDITAMIAYTTSLTSGEESSNHKCPIIKEQAEMEETVHVKEMLDDLFKDKRLFCCQSALRGFQSILNNVAGPSEKERAESFLQRVTVVPDKASERAQQLECKGKIKPRLITIFGTGDRMNMPTVTSSIGFVNAAKQQGVEFVVHIHDLRLFSEKVK